MLELINITINIRTDQQIDTMIISSNNICIKFEMKVDGFIVSYLFVKGTLHELDAYSCTDTPLYPIVFEKGVELYAMDVDPDNYNLIFAGGCKSAEKYQVFRYSALLLMMNDSGRIMWAKAHHIGNKGSLCKAVKLSSSSPRTIVFLCRLPNPNRSSLTKVSYDGSLLWQINLGSGEALDRDTFGL